MIPAAFEYVRAHSPDEALGQLQKHGSDARVLAGGQSLIPAMRFRLARPAVLVDINGIGSFDYIRVSNGTLNIGAIARDSAVEHASWIGECKWSLLRDVSRVVADPVVRQTGTVVGSLCHNDPAGDWTATSLAARASVVVRGKSGQRIVRRWSGRSAISPPPRPRSRCRLLSTARSGRRASRSPLPDPVPCALPTLSGSWSARSLERT